MTIQKPTVLFIHGLWHTPKHFEGVRKIFEDAGYPTSCDLQPSIETLPALGLADDADCIRGVLRKLIEEEGKDMIVIGHSYGGMVMSEAADPQFAKKHRLEEGKKGGILHLVYMCAFLLPIGGSIAGVFGGSLPPGLLETFDGGMSLMANPAIRFYHDMSEKDQQKAISEMRKSPAELNFTQQTKANYTSHPVTYFYCEDDQAIFYSVQQNMVADARKAGVKIAIERCAASHTPFVSMPYRVLEMVQALELQKRV